MTKMMTRLIRPALLALALAPIGFAAAEAQVKWGSSGAAQGAYGRGAAWQKGGSCDPASGSCQHGGSVTTNNGQTYSHDASGSCAQNGAGGVDCSKTATTTGPRGTSSSAAQRSWGNGGASSTVNRTGANGGTSTRSRWLQVQ